MNGYEFMSGFMVAMVLHFFGMWLYRKNLIQKADALNTGQSPVEFIHGKPYVIMHESDYVKTLSLEYANLKKHYGDMEERIKKTHKRERDEWEELQKRSTD